MVFDVIFVVQHYVLYPQREGEDEGSGEDDDRLLLGEDGGASAVQ